MQVDALSAFTVSVAVCPWLAVFITAALPHISSVRKNLSLARLVMSSFSPA